MRLLKALGLGTKLFSFGHADADSDTCTAGMALLP